MLFSTERSTKPKRNPTGRPTNGTISHIPNLFGFMMAGFVLNKQIKKDREMICMRIDQNKCIKDENDR